MPVGKDMHFNDVRLPAPWISVRNRYKSTAPLPDEEQLAPAPSLPPGPSSSTAAARQPSVEEQYSRKTPVEHVLLRPGMYVGPTERLPPAPCWVPEALPDLPAPLLASTDVNGASSEPELHNIRMVRRECSLVPALNKVFDEILVNASDNRLRHPKSCSRVDVIIDPGCAAADANAEGQGQGLPQGRPPLISIYNDGRGIPVQIHRKEKMYVPEMVFGHLMTGSNFDDTAKRITGGRHGYGAKLTNIFSHQFTVETADSRRGLRYRQTWEHNMSVANEPDISPLGDGVGDFTRVTFVPDLAKLTGDVTATTIPSDEYAIMCRRVIDVAGCAGDKLEVTLNGRRVPIGGFQEYAKLYRSPDSPPVVFQRLNSRWEIGIGLSSSGSFECVSFVNGMATPRGGTHVNAIVQQATKKIADRVTRLHPDLSETVSQGLVRRHLCVFVNCLVENPTFDSQMKESLTSSPHTFGSRYSLTEKFLNELTRDEDTEEEGGVGGPGIVEEVIRVGRGRQQANLMKKVGGANKTKRRIVSIPKLDDAHLAGTDSGRDCTLILTEGDSAKALAVAGLEVIGRDRYGVFPLRGKFLNVRDASLDKLANNAEVRALCSILGLDFEKTYTREDERAELRYGHVMLMTDQDNDGSHIKGLMMNFFRHFWPDLLKPSMNDPDGKPFLSCFVTPLMKVTKGKKESHSFYSMAEYNEWRESLPDEHDIRRWNVKYYKGLGTSTPAEAKEYFAAFDSHHRPFAWKSDRDGELLDMLFDKHRASDRRDWIDTEYSEESNVTVDPDDGNSVTFEDFVNNEMIHFSNADNVRSIPSLIDGLKPSQRKVLFACFKRHLKKEMKVAQLAGYCAEHTAYHHGEASLHATIIGMAQDFVGSNNINLLVPSGQFGTRLAGGKDAASPRYIFTALSPTARLLFPEVDDALLEYKEDDGQSIEPETFSPIIPLLLVNGAQGIGTGWSTYIPPHNPRDVLAYIRAKLDGADSSDLPRIRPWARGFKGEIVAKEDGRGYDSIGKIERASSGSVIISELPISKWTNDYKAHLLRMRDRGQIQNIIEDHTTTSVAFTVGMKSVQINRTKSSLAKYFGLESKMLLTNMHAFDGDNAIQRYDSAESIADAYFPTRLQMYRNRKSLLEATLNHSSAVMQNKANFIAAVTEGNVDIVRGQRSKAETIELLRSLGFASSSELDALKSASLLGVKSVATRAADSSSDGGETGAGAKPDKEFDYLMNMPLASLTKEKIQDLREDAKKARKELETIKLASPEDLWRADLDKLEQHL